MTNPEKKKRRVDMDAVWTTLNDASGLDTDLDSNIHPLFHAVWYCDDTALASILQVVQSNPQQVLLMPSLPINVVLASCIHDSTSSASTYLLQHFPPESQQSRLHRFRSLLHKHASPHEQLDSVDRYLDLWISLAELVFLPSSWNVPEGLVKFLRAYWLTETATMPSDLSRILLYSAVQHPIRECVHKRNTERLEFLRFLTKDLEVSLTVFEAPFLPRRAVSATEDVADASSTLRVDRPTPLHMRQSLVFEALQDDDYVLLRHLVRTCPALAAWGHISGDPLLLQAAQSLSIPVNVSVRTRFFLLRDIVEKGGIDINACDIRSRNLLFRLCRGIHLLRSDETRAQYEAAVTWTVRSAHADTYCVDVWGETPLHEWANSVRLFAESQQQTTVRQTRTLLATKTTAPLLAREIVLRSPNAIFHRSYGHGDTLTIPPGPTVSFGESPLDRLILPSDSLQRYRTRRQELLDTLRSEEEDAVLEADRRALTSLVWQWVPAELIDGRFAACSRVYAEKKATTRSSMYFTEEMYD